MSQWWTGQKNGSQISDQSPWFDALCNHKHCSAPFSSQRLRNLALRYEIALRSPIRLKSPTSHSVAFYLLSQNQVQPLSLKAFISGELTWQRGGFLSSELSIKASGVMCQLTLFRGSLCVRSGSVTAWAGAFYLGPGEIIQIVQNRIIAAGISIPCQGFFASKSKKGLHRRNRLFCLLLYASLTAFRASKKCSPENLTCSCGLVLYSSGLCVFMKCVWIHGNKICTCCVWTQARPIKKLSNYTSMVICRDWNTTLWKQHHMFRKPSYSFHWLINSKQTWCTFLLQVSTQEE